MEAGHYAIVSRGVENSEGFGLASAQHQSSLGREPGHTCESFCPQSRAQYDLKNLITMTPLLSTCHVPGIYLYHL